MKNKIQSFLTTFILLFPLLTFAALDTPTEDFIDNNDGTVTHKKTWLTWQRCAVGQTWTGTTCSGTPSTFTWDSASKLTSNFAGKTDWHIPRIDELKSIVEHGGYSPAANKTIFPNSITDTVSIFWSASALISDPQNNTKWSVSLQHGDVYFEAKSLSRAIRLVSGSRSFSSLGEYTASTEFTDNKDGTITHNKTNLMWQRCAVGQTWTGTTCNGTATTMHHLEATQQKSVFANYSDWRLPKNSELGSIVEYQNISPSINKNIFPNTPSTWFWTVSDDFVNSNAASWIVDFINGTEGIYLQGYDYAVRLVRNLTSSSTNTKLASPVLQTPADFSKNIAKYYIQFTWQASQNKTASYRIVISETLRFTGYNSNTGRCNATCVVGVTNAYSYSTSLRSSNKTYYWHIQEVATSGNSDWSHTNSFKTDGDLPSITNASALPSSTTVGNSVNFSATLSNSLPSNYSVKLIYGTSTVNMTGSGTSYSVSQTPSQLGQQVFSVGIYDSSNTLKGTAFKGNFEVVKGNSMPVLSFISGNETVIADTSYTLQLKASDADNNLNTIKVVWGDGTNDSQFAENGTTLTFTHIYNAANSYTWNANAVDSNNASSSTISRDITVSASVTPSAYTKISNTGAVLSDTAELGTGQNDWACTKDNKTGLIWEVKKFDEGWQTSDVGLHNMSHGYTNFTEEYPKCDDGVGGAAGWCSKYIGKYYGASTNTDVFIKDVNTETFCGATNWRLPTVDELVKLFVCSDGKYNSDGTCTNDSTVSRPTINSFYFPNTASDWVWSSLPSKNTMGSRAWIANFTNGQLSNSETRYSTHRVRLVHSTATDSSNTASNTISKSVSVTTSSVTPPVSTIGYTKISNTGAVIPDTAVLGSGPNDWACTKDNKTGLIWEIKTGDGGLRDNGWYYSWYEPDSNKNGGFAGSQSYEGDKMCYGIACDTYAYKNLVNGRTLCGASDWRLPTKDELMKLVVCADDKYEADGSCTNYKLVTGPTINSTYFPNTKSKIYWSSSTYVGYIESAWYVSFGLSNSKYAGKGNHYSVQLVRGIITPDYIKISNTGAVIPDTAVLGSGPNDWACTKDNKTGLIWEIKTGDGGLRDKDWYYSWYEPDSNKNFGVAGYTDINYATPNCSTKNNCNTYAFTNAVNAKGLCGASDWRLPTKDELMKLVVCSDGKYEADGTCTNYKSVTNPTINSTYFPNTKSSVHWSSSTYAKNFGTAWYVAFDDGSSQSNDKRSGDFVRLVH